MPLTTLPVRIDLGFFFHVQLIYSGVSVRTIKKQMRGSGWWRYVWAGVV